MAIDSQGTLLVVLVTAASKTDGPEAAAVMVQAIERHPTIKSFTADKSYQRQGMYQPRKSAASEALTFCCSSPVPVTLSRP